MVDGSFDDLLNRRRQPPRLWQQLKRANRGGEHLMTCRKGVAPHGLRFARARIRFIAIVGGDPKGCGPRWTVGAIHVSLASITRRDPLPPVSGAPVRAKSRPRRFGRATSGDDVTPERPLGSVATLVGKVTTRRSVVGWLEALPEKPTNLARGRSGALCGTPDPDGDSLGLRTE